MCKKPAHSTGDKRLLRRNLQFLAKYMHFEYKWLVFIPDHAKRASIVAPFLHMFALSPEASSNKVVQEVALLQATHRMATHYRQAALQEQDVPEPRRMFADVHSDASNKLVELLNLDREEMWHHWYGACAQWDLLVVELEELLVAEHGGVWSRS